MKRFIISVLTASVFFIGLGAMIQSVGARFKSDEKALEIVRAARTAIGGDAAIKEFRSLVIVGKTTHSFKFNGVEKSEIGETEIALQLPDKLMKMIKIGDDKAVAAGEKVLSDHHEITILGKSDGDKVTFEGNDGEFTTAEGRKFTFTKGDNAEFITQDGKKVIVRTTGDEAKATLAAGGDAKVFVRKQGDGNGTWTTDGGKDVVLEKVHATGHEGMRQNEIMKFTLGLLLSAPEGMDVSYTFGGESDLDGTVCNIVNASFGGSTYKLYIGRSTNLPVAIGFTGHRMPEIMHFNKEVPPPADGGKDVVMFKRHMDGPGETGEFLMRFSDYRNTDGVQLPYKWTTTSGGQTVEVFDVSSYDVNPENIAEKFAGQKTMVRMKKPDGN